MSKIGEMPITLSPEVKVEITGNSCTIKGKEGELKIVVPSSLKVQIKDEQVSISKQGEDKKNRALHGLYRSLIANAVAGVQKPWEKRLEVVGTGYSVQAQGENLVFKVGYSHVVTFPQVPGIKFKTEENKITISGIDKQLVGQVAQRIKAIKKPDPYKGKGIKYEGEQIKIKPGKKTGATEGAV
jgi:large subunit ribosomal protein L6